MLSNGHSREYSHLLFESLASPRKSYLANVSESGKSNSTRASTLFLTYSPNSTCSSTLFLTYSPNSSCSSTYQFDILTKLYLCKYLFLTYLPNLTCSSHNLNTQTRPHLLARVLALAKLACE